MKLLHIDSSILGDASTSRRLTAEVVARFAREVPDLEVTRRDLAADPLPHLSPELLAGASSREVEWAELRAELARSKQALDEFLEADVVVVGAPMYNFSIPTQLKAWLDRLAVAGTTFRYGPSGVEGLVKGKRLVVVSTRGGVYAPDAAADHQEAYLRTFFEFIGVTDLELVRAEGLARGPASKQAALETAADHVAQLEPSREETVAA